MKLTGKQKLFVEAYLGEAKFNATQAARIAGYRGSYSTLAGMGHENINKPHIRAAIQDRLKESAMWAEEVLKELATIARDPAHPGQLRALEVLARHHGLLSDKRTNVNLNYKLEELSNEQLRQLAIGKDPTQVLDNGG